MSGASRSASIVAAVAVVALLTGCSYVNRVAARLNPDGSLDFATCDERDIDGLEVNWEFIDVPSNDDELVPPVTTPVTGEINVGDVFHLDVSAPDANWVWVSINGIEDGTYANLHGYFSAADLAAGEWVWNQTGVFVGAVDVQHCELDENIR